MKYLKKYNESLDKKIGLNSFDDDELRERLEYLRIERDDIQNEMSTIYNILKDRKENSEEEYAKTLPESIFDFNKEQLDWIFQNNHTTTNKHRKIADEYFNKYLKGVHNFGFNNKTNQFSFNISTSHFMNDEQSKFETDELAIKTIKFLGNNLKKIDHIDQPFVNFEIVYYFNDYVYNDSVRFISDNDIQLFRHDRLANKFNSIEELLEYIVENDLTYND